MALRKIRLYGQLAKFVGESVLEAEVSNAAQAVRFLCVNFEGIEKHMADQYYKVSAGNWDMTENELLFPTGKSCLLYTSPSPRDRQKSRMPSSA